MTAQTETKPAGLTASRSPLTYKRENLWQDAFRRLLRNRAAVIGGVIVILLALVAIFANLIAIMPYDKQTLPDQNKVPLYMGKLFPSMIPYMKVSDKYPLGADYVGRGIFSRVVS